MKTIAQKIEDSGIETVEIRSVLTCESKRGVCVKCYGKNLATGTWRKEVMQLVSLLHSRSVNRVHSLPCVPSTWVVWQVPLQ